MTTIKAIRQHQAGVRKCTLCPDMNGPPVTGEPVVSPVMLVGQAPGPREIEQRRPFAWTAGKTLFGWFEGIGLDEQAFRSHVYMAAVCRCFPGKSPKGGDRVPAPAEIDNCSRWINRELELLHPELIIPVGKLAISQFMTVDKLSTIVGGVHSIDNNALCVDLIPLPHPSGASTWHRTEPGKKLLRQALDAIAGHPAWQSICRTAAAGH